MVMFECYPGSSAASSWCYPGSAMVLFGGGGGYPGIAAASSECYPGSAVVLFGGRGGGLSGLRSGDVRMLSGLRSFVFRVLSGLRGGAVRGGYPGSAVVMVE